MDETAQLSATAARSQADYRLIAKAIPGTTWTAQPDGTLDHVADGNSPWQRRPAADRLGDRWLDVLHPDDRERVRQRWRHSVESGDPYEISFRAVMADGSYRWQLVRALPQRGSDGVILRWIGMNVDIDDRVRADIEREKFVALADNSSDMIGMTDVDGIIVYLNRNALDFTGLGYDDVGKRHYLDLFAQAQPDIEPALERDGRWQGEVRFRHFITHQSLPVFFSAFVLKDEHGAKIGLGMINRDLRDRLHFDIGLSALAEAGKAMHSSLDLKGTLQNIADSVAAGFATACSVEIETEDGSIQTITIAHRNPAHLAQAWQAARVRNPAVGPEHPIRRAISRNESTLLRTLPPAFLQSTGLDRHIGEGQGQINLRSIIYVPVRSARNGRTVGALSCAIDATDPRGSYTEDDVRFAEEIALRAGIAFDNANTFERTNRIAVALQAASLPSTLPACRGLHLDADYRPATDEATIGGDWYDAFALPDGRIVMTVGDVVGHGLQAAIRMTKIRQAMQSAAMLKPDPGIMLDAADRILQSFDREVFASALAAIYDQRTTTLVLASAGHVGPAILRHHGTFEVLRFPGFMLGFGQGEPYTSHTIALHGGDTLVFYTDGLVETQRDDRTGHARLERALRDGAVRSSASPAQAIVEHVLGNTAIRDDIAVLVAHVAQPLDVTHGTKE